MSNFSQLCVARFLRAAPTNQVLIPALHAVKIHDIRVIIVSSCCQAVQEGACNFEILRKTSKSLNFGKTGSVSRKASSRRGTPASQPAKCAIKWTEIRDEKSGGKCAENGIEFRHRTGHFVAAGFGGKEILTGLERVVRVVTKSTEIISCMIAPSGWHEQAHARGRLLCCWQSIEKGGKSRGSETKSAFFCLKSRC